MEIIYLLIPISLIILVLAIILFIWSIKSGQFEDLKGPAHRIIFDDKAEQKRIQDEDEH